MESIWEGGLQVRDARTGAAKVVLKGSARVAQIAFLPDGCTLAGAMLPAILRLWDVRTGRPGSRFEAPELITALAASVDGKWLAAGCDDGRIYLCDAKTAKLLRVWPASRGLVHSLAPSPAGQLASGGEDGLNKIWNPQTGELLRTLSGHTEAVTTLAYSPSGALLASGDGNGWIRLWRAATGRLEATLRVIPSSTEGAPADWIAFTPDGFYNGSPGIERLIRWRTGDDALQPAGAVPDRRRPDVLERRLAP